MLFLDPKSDMAFKKLFGTVVNKNILMSFLNGVLERVDGEKIVDVTFNDLTNIAETPLSKASIVDVRCTDQNNNQYIIEMQVVKQQDYALRAQYYSALALSRQLGVSEQYNKLVPVIFVGILDFTLFTENEDYLSQHLFLNKKTHAHILKHIQLHFIELDKFKKTLRELDTMLDKWLYVLKHAVTMQKKPASFKEPVLNAALDVLAQSNWSRKELEAYDRYLDAIRSGASQLDTARADGRAEGIEEGAFKKAVDVATKLLRAKIDVTTISEVTGLDLATIKKLKKK